MKGAIMVMPRQRSRLIVSIELDPIPGWGNSPEDHSAWLQVLLDGLIPHYHPAVLLDAVNCAVADPNPASRVPPSDCKFCDFPDRKPDVYDTPEEKRSHAVHLLSKLAYDIHDAEWDARVHEASLFARG